MQPIAVDAQLAACNLSSNAAPLPTPPPAAVLPPAPPPANERKSCTACCEALPRAGFSAKQWKGADAKRRCSSCVAADRPVTVTVCDISGGGKRSGEPMQPHNRVAVDFGPDQVTMTRMHTPTAMEKAKGGQARVLPRPWICDACKRVRLL